MKLTLPIGWVLLLASCSVWAQQYVISTVAGGAPPPTPIAAVNASIGSPIGIATDSTGNVYFGSLNCIFKLDQSGVLNRVAGNARLGYSGDGGAAISAQLNGTDFAAGIITGIAVDPGGNVYVADFVNGLLRRVSSTGIITSVGAGLIGFPSGVAVDSSGNIYVADTNGRIQKIPPSGSITTVAGNGTPGYSGDGGPAISAQLAHPLGGLAVDSTGNLYIADSGNNRIRKVSQSGIITTVAGNGTSGYSGDGGPATSAQLWNPKAIALDGAGNVYIADFSNGRIRRISQTGIITTVAGNGMFRYSGDGGLATSASLWQPDGVAVDSAGNLYIADAANLRIRRVSTDSIITTVAGNGTYSYSGDGGAATSAQIGFPSDVAVDTGGNILITDAARIRKVSRRGIITTLAGNGTSGFSGDGGPSLNAQLVQPTGVTGDAGGNVYTADSGNSRIRKVSPSGIITSVAGNGAEGYSGDDGLAVNSQLRLSCCPVGIASDKAGNVYFADAGNTRIRKISPGGIITTVAGNGSSGYSGDGGPATSAQLDLPLGVAVDGTGGNLYFADSNNSRIRRVSSSGIITTVAGNGDRRSSGDGGPAINAGMVPKGIAVDTAGNLYVSDNFLIRKISLDGIITTIAGSDYSSHGYSGDGSPATKARLNYPHGVTVDSEGNVYVADGNNQAIRLLQPAGIGSTVLSINAGGSVNASSYTVPVAPGSIAAVFGNFLLASPVTSTMFPIPTSLSGLSLQFGGTPLAPLFFASVGQVNAQVPWELAGQSQTTITAMLNGQNSSAQTVNLAPYAPGIFTTNSEGTGQGAILDTSYRLVDPKNPATAGSSVVQIYCTGLGPVTNQPATRTPALSSPLSMTTAVPTVMIGGAPASVLLFSGLAPGFVGEYQVNVGVPLASAKGSAVPVVISIGGAMSNTVTIAVQ